MRRSFFAFLSLCLIGIIAATFVYRNLQTDDSGALVLQNRATINLSDADKKLIDVRDSTSKWLLGLAFSLLPGLIIRKASDGKTTVQDQVLPLLAGAMVLLSLYGFFLAQDAVAFVLSRGPQYHLYGWLTSFPILLQFWSLLAALALLMLHWLRPVERVVFPTLGLLVVVLVHPESAFAQAATPVATRVCVTSWASTREVPLTGDEVGLAANVVAGVARRADISPPDLCEFTSAHLDQVRFAAARTATSTAPYSVADALRDVDKDLRSTAVSPGAVLERVLSLSELWRKPSGLLRVEGKPNGATVLLNARAVGLTNLDLRLRPGTYVVEVLADGVVVFRRPDVRIEDGKLWKATFGS